MSANHSQQLIDAPCFAGLTPLTEPRSVAAIGVSSDSTRVGGRPIAYILRYDYAGQILPVNPNRAEIQELPAFVSVTELPQAPDVTIITVLAPQVLETARMLNRQGARSAVMFSSGFSGVGEVGAATQNAVVTAAREHGMCLPGPNALGVFNNNPGYYALFSISLEHGVPLPGRIDIAIQSGACGAHLLDIARQRHPGTPICVVTGNEVDVTLDDGIGWLVESPKIDMVMAYVESICSVDSLLAALEAAHHAGRPVTLHKVGRSALGSRTTLSHTVSLVGDDKVLDAVLGNCMVIHTGTTEELTSIAYLATQRIYPVGSSLGVITISGGAGITVSDVVEEVGLPMSPMPDTAQEQLKTRLSLASLVNPMDCTTQALNDLVLVCDFIESMMIDGGCRLLFVFFIQTDTVASIGARLAEQLRRIKEAHPERLFTVSVVGEGEKLAPYEEAGFALLEDPTRVVVTTQAMGQLGEAFARPLRLYRSADGLQLSASTPGKAEAKRLLAHVGIESAVETVLDSAGETIAFAEGIGYLVVLKFASVDTQHKSEVGGVLLDVSDVDVVHVGFQLLPYRAAEKAPQARLGDVLVARQLRGGVECFTGIQCDPLFGPVTLFGLGGVFVEILQDVVFRRCPFEVDEAETMIHSIGGTSLLFSARGRLRADATTLTWLLSSLSRLT